VKLLNEYKNNVINSLDKFKALYDLDSFPMTADGRSLGGAIAYSEAFAFCSMCDFFGVNRIIESGVRNGGSTKLIHLYFGDDVKLSSVDKKIEPRLRNIMPKVEFVEGFGNEEVPKLLNSVTENDIIGIILDGPKGTPAIKLAEECLELNNVKFVAIHDTYKKDNPTREKIEAMNNKFFSTDAEWFVKSFSELDKPDKSFESRYSNYGSYSFTLSFIINPMYLK